MISAALAILESEEQRNELSELYEQNIKKFYSIAYSKLHNKEDAEDAIQEAFLAVANNPDVLFSISDEKRVSYINVIIRNISYKIWNKRHKIYENETELNDDIEVPISTEEIALSHYSCKQVLDYIDTLSESSKSALYLKMQFGLKNSDIAKLLGISEEAAKKRILRASNLIKNFMEDIKDE